MGSSRSSCSRTKDGERRLGGGDIPRRMLEEAFGESSDDGGDELDSRSTISHLSWVEEAATEPRTFNEDYLHLCVKTKALEFFNEIEEKEEEERAYAVERAQAFPFFSLALFLLLLAVAAEGETGSKPRLGWFPPLSGCRGTVAECLAGEEFELGSIEAISRRVLTTSKYISYGALRRDRTPGSQSGASYYNCRPGASANPYSRSCYAITRCRG